MDVGNHRGRSRNTYSINAHTLISGFWTGQEEDKSSAGAEKAAERASVLRNLDLKTADVAKMLVVFRGER